MLSALGLSFALQDVWDDPRPLPTTYQYLTPVVTVKMSPDISVCSLTVYSPHGFETVHLLAPKDTGVGGKNPVHSPLYGLSFEFLLPLLNLFALTDFSESSK